MRDAEGWEEWRSAWQRALYGPAGFYRREQPHDHFRTAVSASTLFAEAVLTFLRQEGVSSVTDLGAGDGRLLAHLRRLAPDLALTGVDLRKRPTGLDPSIGWQRELPAAMTGLVLANELLDNVPC
ncbi:MAG: SAM-dependent methyltransferase, partial [Nocardioidaceae bacterium]